jgi:hypothetical protein
VAYDPFSTKTAAEVLALLSKAEDDLAAGSAIISAGAGDVSTARIVQKSLEQRTKLLRQSLYAKDSTTYAAFKYANHNRTVGIFS